METRIEVEPYPYCINFIVNDNTTFKLSTRSMSRTDGYHRFISFTENDVMEVDSAALFKYTGVTIDKLTDLGEEIKVQMDEKRITHIQSVELLLANGQNVIVSMHEIVRFMPVYLYDNSLDLTVTPLRVQCVTITDDDAKNGITIIFGNNTEIVFELLRGTSSNPTTIGFRINNVEAYHADFEYRIKGAVLVHKELVEECSPELDVDRNIIKCDTLLLKSSTDSYEIYIAQRFVF